ncbi:3-isopropylmalate dehydratase small subunit [Novosphingobium aquimarinum]|uniref:3-isopropylmalate dehydratase small subunit n=1 Tax=Novosphingobium aquimarinum TaxID=2682494 RepID=UPI0012EC0717|nr:3-isopropylmalate dehydratase small subunit [Novosphingobium aquimarinum]
MQPFTTLTGTAVPLPMANVDTDQILPKQFLKTVKRTGLEAGLFYDLRFDEAGGELADFILNRPAYRTAAILVGGDNFGCGSSREHAPWALLDFGIRCVIAPSFAEIFYQNCINNGLLPVELAAGEVERISEEAQASPNGFVVDLINTQVRCPSGTIFCFAIGDIHKQRLLKGLDLIGDTLQYASDIDQFESEQSW